MPPSPITISAARQAELLAAAKEAAQRAYAPYSGFRVGAALLVEPGEIVTAANVENTSYSLTLCAERAAIARAIAQHGPQVRIVAAAVTNLHNAPSSPCGACRQVLAEFMPPGGLVLFPFDGTLQTRTLAELLPLGFYLAHAE
ncbi:MAG TPA: cytidine deaminase [Acidobacteriaceae bacterium]|jgi:homotetrameric cytidine deaminase